MVSLTLRHRLPTDESIRIQFQLYINLCEAERLKSITLRSALGYPEINLSGFLFRSDDSFLGALFAECIRAWGFPGTGRLRLPVPRLSVGIAFQAFCGIFLCVSPLARHTSYREINLAGF